MRERGEEGEEIEEMSMCAPYEYDKPFLFSLL